MALPCPLRRAPAVVELRTSSVLVPVSPQQAFLALRLHSCLSLSLHQLLSKPRPKTELARAAHMNLTSFPRIGASGLCLSLACCHDLPMNSICNYMFCFSLTSATRPLVLRKRLNGVLPCGKDYCQRTGVPPSRQPWCWAAKKHASSSAKPRRLGALPSTLWSRTGSLWTMRVRPPVKASACAILDGTISSRPRRHVATLELRFRNRVP